MAKEKELREDVEKAEKALDKAKEAFIRAGDRLEAARTAYLDARGEDAQAAQVKEA